jgi:hypothetical protein
MHYLGHLHLWRSLSGAGAGPGPGAAAKTRERLGYSRYSGGYHSSGLSENTHVLLAIHRCDGTAGF